MLYKRIYFIRDYRRLHGNVLSYKSIYNLGNYKKIYDIRGYKRLYGNLGYIKGFMTLRLTDSFTVIDNEISLAQRGTLCNLQGIETKLFEQE